MKEFSPGVNPNCCDQKDCSLEAAVAGVSAMAPKIFDEDPKGVGAPMSCVTLWGVSMCDLVVDENMTSVDLSRKSIEWDVGAGVLLSVGGGISNFSVSFESFLADSGAALTALRETSANDLKQLSNSLSPEESKKLVFAALPEMGEILSRLIRDSPMDTFIMAASFPIRK